MPQCAVASCNNTHRKTKGGSVKYHRFPGDEKTRRQWLNACGRHVPNTSTARICSLHFSPDCYEKDMQHELLGLPTRCRLKKGAMPDRHLPNDDNCYITYDAFPSPSSSISSANHPPSPSTDSAIAVLLAVGLVPAAERRANGGLPQE